MSDRNPVGLVGIGLLGQAFAHRLLEAGFEVVGFDVDPAKNAKLAINLILGLNRLAVAEGLVFAERLGLDPEAFLKVARSSAAYSQVMDIKGSKMIRGEFGAEGRVTQHLKDVRLMLAQAERVKQQLPLLEIHADVLEACVRQGEGDLDNSAVIKEIRRRTRP